MKTVWPDYYRQFHCIAGRCAHTCCAGWEIDVDDDFLERFQDEPEVMRHVRDGAIVLDASERCPFLQEDGLCRLIVRWGEEALCDICREHPRFYVDHGGHEEAGVGLVCEEACRLVLDWDHDFRLTPARPLPPEIRLVFDRRRRLSRRLAVLSPTRGDAKARTGWFLGMEVMDPRWTALLTDVRDHPASFAEEDDLLDARSRPFANFCTYLLYRHPGAARFAAESTRLLADLVLRGAEIHDAARMFSGEVEYSDVNLEMIERLADGRTPY